MSHTRRLTPDQVVANIPVAALRAICATDPDLCALDATLDALKLQRTKGNEGDKENAAANVNRKTRSKNGDAQKTKTKTTKKTELTGPEARRRIELEVERGAVRLLCERLPKPLLVDAVTSLGIECGEGNNPTSRAVLTKRLAEHISKAHDGVGIAAFLEEEASKDVLRAVAEALPAVTRPASATSETIQAALEHEALMTFFASLPEELLHDVCFAMKNERPQGDTHSRQVLAASIVSDRPVAELVADANGASSKEKTKKKVKLSKKKPKLREGVTYEDVFQWYNLSELQDYARDNGIKVSGKKKEVIQRVLAFLADPDSIKADASARRKKAKPATKKAKPATEKAASPTPKPAASSFKPDPELARLLVDIVKGCTSSQKGLSAEQIDAYEAKLSKTAGVPVRLPEALRQLFMHCNGYSTHYEPPAEDGAGVSVYPLVATSDTPEEWLLDRDIALGNVQEEWLSSFVEEGGKPEDCVASPHWLPFASGATYTYYFVNVDPTTTQRYGQVYAACCNEGCGETLFCGSIAEFIEKTAKYIKLCDRKRQEILEEDPDTPLDELPDLVDEEVQFGDDDDVEEDEDEDKEEDEDAAGDDDDDENSDEDGEQEDAKESQDVMDE